ncbi:MAG TPA: copper-binding protein [Gemmatimonadales bacterium]|nr:copper-binding protein [Gemmatimonadales bacterium]
MNPSRGHVLLVVASLVLDGCAAYRLPPLAAGHPANLGAPTASKRPPSQILAYTATDIPSARPISPMVAVPQGEHRPRETDRETSQTAVGEGEVVAAVPNSSQIVLEHGEIKGFMEAMTMGYRVDPPSLLAGLNPGDKVRFTIDVQRRAIIEIEKLPTR